ncbi:unnamed protein product [Miscanthus lutarioriparius]|uniref:Homeobox domain-containing protein n=1 Tax=Miscanthus lutarioriparius TaxID=422564 RepID=A0A811SGI3_9POAL|nr:unnamed protein product [Miscanthus lutarioriparius]
MPSQQQQQQGQPQPQPQVVAGSTRWCPTPEQLMILEEMYRGGLRTPNASQIQHITAHLACYGRIEGKNVFYWFQNHKAQDRQKLRRRLCMSHHLLSCAQYYAAAAHHGGFLAAAPPPVAPYGHHQLLSPSTSPTPAAAAAARRCGGGGGGGLVPAAEALGRPEYSSLGKLDNFGVALDDVVVSSASTAVDMTTPPGFEVAPQPASFCRPLKTLDLFPGGLKEEQHDVA